MSDKYNTTDWEEVVWLLVNNVPLLDTERQGPQQVEFQFDTPDRCNNLIRGLSTQSGRDQLIFEKTLASIRKARTAIRRTF